MSVVVDFTKRNPRPGLTTGIIWDTTTLPNGIGSWVDIAFGDGYFFGVSSAGALNSGCRGTDGYNWSAINMPAALAWVGVDFGEHVFCAVNNNGIGNQFARSIDGGSTWLPVAEPANLLWTDLCYCGASTWIAVASNGLGNQFAISTDNGASWASIAEPANLQWQACVADPITGVVIAIAQNGLGNQIGRSASRGAGGTWVSIAESVNDTWNSLAFGRWNNGANTAFVSVAASGLKQGMYSLDLGSSWLTSVQADGNNYGVAYGNNRFVSVSHSSDLHIRNPYSYDSINWQYVDHTMTGGLGGRLRARSICYGVDRFVCLGADTTTNCAVSL